MTDALARHPHFARTANERDITQAARQQMIHRQPDAVLLVAHHARPAASRMRLPHHHHRHFVHQRFQQRQVAGRNRRIVAVAAEHDHPIDLAIDNRLKNRAFVIVVLRAAVGRLGIVQGDFVTDGQTGLLNLRHQRDEVRVSDVRDDHRERIALARYHAARHQVGAELMLGDHLFHPRAGFFRYPRMLVEHARDGSDRHTGEYGNILDGEIFAHRRRVRLFVAERGRRAVAQQLTHYAGGKTAGRQPELQLERDVIPPVPLQIFRHHQHGAPRRIDAFTLQQAQQIGRARQLLLFKRQRFALGARLAASGQRR
ncbi:hypothetical protein COLO4_01245, partial [Corchorus olitorius]